ncbi:MAG: aldehyde ferredoxin oxidoreductase family protein [Candidatus Lokiarchaeota archaeon]|nr:aldehyde ferredoxin oxidoreductase family protein [Candidatus Lokiarchaeota archaeon]
MKGLNNKILEVDLNHDKFNEVPVPEEILLDYIGGRGLGVKLLSDKLPVNLNPLDPKNLLIFATGPFGGTIVPTNGRFSLVTKSPLTNGIFYSNSGGSFGVVMKRCGYDGILIQGALKEPGYLLIEGGKDIAIKEASRLWGCDTEKTLEEIKKIEGNRINSLMIGPAGENLIKIAAIMNDAARAFGRGGVGAVMGSKNLKAIVVKGGDTKIDIDNRDLLKKYVKVAQDKIKVVPITRSSLPKFGTSALVNVINILGMFPINNFQRGFDERATQVSGEEINEKLTQEHEGCYACPIRCGRLTKAGDMKGKGPEFESVWALGPNLGIYDLITVTQANYLCNKYGIDTISCGGSIACAMELQERRLLKDSSLQFGNSSILKELVKKIALKEDIGAQISEGSRLLSKSYNSEEVAMQVKGLELPAYDPRGAIGHALGYATSNRGGCHLTGYMAALEIFAAPKKIDRFTMAGKPDLLVLKQNQKAIEDSLVICAFAGWALGLDYYARFMKAITGIDYDVVKLLEIGERIYNLERIFNIREGLSKKDDILPPRFISEPLKEGVSKGHIVPLEKMLEQYYYVRGWDNNGFPEPELLEKLGIKHI